MMRKVKTVGLIGLLVGIPALAGPLGCGTTSVPGAACPSAEQSTDPLERATAHLDDHPHAGQADVERILGRPSLVKELENDVGRAWWHAESGMIVVDFSSRKGGQTTYESFSRMKEIDRDEAWDIYEAIEKGECVTLRDVRRRLGAEGSAHDLTENRAPSFMWVVSDRMFLVIAATDDSGECAAWAEWTRPYTW